MKSIENTERTTDHPWLRLALLAGVAMVIVTFAISLTRYPDILSIYPRQAPLFLGLLAILLMLYGWLAVDRTRSRSAADSIAVRHSLLWGIVVGLLWVAEIWAGNIAQPAPGFQEVIVHGLIYRGAILAVPIVTVFGAGTAAARARRWSAGMWVGIWSGAISALMVFAGFLALGLVFPTGRPDPQTLAEFQRTGLTDFAAYSTAEALTAMINHLWIGPGLGVLCGLFGGVIGGGLAPRPASAAGSEGEAQPPRDNMAPIRLGAAE